MVQVKTYLSSKQIPKFIMTTRWKMELIDQFNNLLRLVHKYLYNPTFYICVCTNYK